MKKINIKRLIVVIVIIIAVVIGVKFLFNSKEEKVKEPETFYGNLESEVWVTSNGILKVDDGETKITLTLKSDLNFDENAEQYEYTIPYSLVVGDKEYTGEYTFGNGYYLHSEENNVPYDVKFTDFKNGSVGVSVSRK